MTLTIGLQDVTGCRQGHPKADDRQGVLQQAPLAHVH